MKLSNIQVGPRLIAAFVTVAPIGAAIGMIGIRGMSTLDAEAEKLYQIELLGLSHAKEVNISLLYVGPSVRNAVLATTDESRKQSLSNVARNLDKVKSDG